MIVEHILQFHGSDHVLIYPVAILFLPAGIENFESRGNQHCVPFKQATVTERYEEFTLLVLLDFPGFHA